MKQVPKRDLMTKFNNYRPPYRLQQRVKHILHSHLYQRTRNHKCNSSNEKTNSLIHVQNNKQTKILQIQRNHRQPPDLGQTQTAC